MIEITRRRPALILVHGAGRSSRMWHRTAALLRDGYDVLTPDLPGFRSDGSRFGLDAAAVRLLELARSRPDGASVFGLSLGATVAIRAAALQAAASPSARGTGGRGPIQGMLLSAPAIAPMRYQAGIVRRYRRVPDLLARTVSDATSWRTLVDELSRIDVEPDLATMDVPVLVLCGARDRANLPDACRAAEAIPGGR
jgi:3-oxoadipate enol-lactonase